MSPAPAPFTCSLCGRELRTFAEAETYRPYGKARPSEVRCVDRAACDLRVARKRRGEEVRNALS